MIVALIAAHQEDPRQLAAAIRSLRPWVDGVQVAASPGDEPPARFFPRDWLNVNWTIVQADNEREKRNALLVAARVRWPHLKAADWFLTLDPDEILIGGDWLELLLERSPAGSPCYCLPRYEVLGGVTLIPAHLFRADVSRYVYLDVGIEWHGELWDLDPRQVEIGPPPGWPAIVHYGSPRADNMADDGWYTEPQAVTYDRRYFE